MRTAAFGVLALVASGSVACQDEATKRCHDVMTTAQELVKNVDSKDRESVQKSLDAVTGALDACTQAKRQTEMDQLTRARNQLAAHRDYMESKAARAARKKRSPEELAALVTKGDPDCPKGQAYKPDPNGKEIRCTGPQIVDMNFPKAHDYFTSRGYKITTADSPPTLTAEYGAEKFVFSFAAPKDENAARCLTLYPVPGIPYQEAAGRATGVQMKKLDKDGTVKTEHGEIPIHVEESEQKLVIRLGTCG